ncbi:carbon-nitrogen hydrolase family protein [Cesiribacter sp. SM1]|uniref:carbon-nitrogen hydrolase family protein n=1 Tax=Cesiribacter sp. SM1 TaxID=2861196 RepID=UPI001CD647A9|nr:carbon-nitrogen hydrolase family protein [Cesiribacter sp. SM1]
MKICIAQIRPYKGNIAANTKAHLGFIELAVFLQADAIFFPELSLTCYEPELAFALATEQEALQLRPFQRISDSSHIAIGLGLPVKSLTGVQIGMVIFRPGQPRLTYSKQQLHTDEYPYFEPGSGQLILQLAGKKIAPAICYESLQPAHAENAFNMGAQIYLASVAKSASGVTKARQYYPEVAGKYAMPVLMANSIGFCDNFLSVGNSAVWSKTGVLLGQLDQDTEGILVFDTETEEVVQQLV